ncbi:MAG: hypothetical protein ACPL25_04995 [Ignavibacteria bacterium]
MKNSNNILIKIIILDHNLFITEAIEEILKDYPCNIKRVKNLSEIKEICDYLIFYQESINDKLIEEIASLPEFVRRKVLVYERDFKIPTRLIPYLQDVINIKELDFLLKELMDYHILIHSEKTKEEEIELVQRLMNDSSHYIHSMFVYSEVLRNSLAKRSDSNADLLLKFEKILKEFEAEFLSFQNFIFISKIPLKFEDINILIQRVLRERESDLQNKTNKLEYLPDYSLPMVKVNPVVINKIINNLLDLILVSAKNIISIEISTRNYNKYLEMNIKTICSEFDRTLRYQIYNPFFPRSILENVFINYFRIKIEKFLKMSFHDYFNKNELSLVMRMEIGE